MSHGLMDFWPVGMIVKFFAKAGVRIIFHFSLARNDRQTEFGRHHAHNGSQLNAVVVHASTLQTVCHKIGIAAQPCFEKFPPIELLPMILKTNQ